MKIIYCILIALFTIEINAAELITYKYEEILDNSAVSIIGANKKTKELIFIEKVFLSKWKAKLNYERSRHVIYNIVEGRNSTSSALLLKHPSEEKVTIGKAAWISNGYVIPVLRGSGVIEGYKYSLDTRKTTKIFTHSKVKKSYISSIVAFSKGYIVVSGFRAGVVAHYYGYDNNSDNPIELFKSEMNIRSISDFTEREGKIFLTGNRINVNRVSVWSYDFTIKQGKINANFTDLLPSNEDQNNKTVFIAKFIQSMNSIPSILILKKESAFNQKGEFMIMRLGEKKKITWKKTMSNINAGENILVSEFCGKNFLMIKKLTNRKSYSQKISFKIIDNDGLEKKIDIKSPYGTEMILAMRLYALEKQLYVLANVRKFEKTRRPDGLYSWLGYRLDTYNVSPDCSIN